MSNSAVLASTEHENRVQKRRPSLTLQCSACRNPLPTVDLSESLSSVCSECGFILAIENDIFRCLAPACQLHFAQFVREYELVRKKEGRGSSAADYYLELPFKDLTGQNSWQWLIRARTWRHMETRILPKIESFYPEGCDILDIGAGNCWLSYRLALRGHRPVAVDLLDNDADGLGAARHYLARLSRPFSRFQAEMDRLPFVPAQFDVAIFNASVHYSVRYETTLAETLRCLRRPGHVIISDSPFYSCGENGQKMVAEKHVEFERRFGFPSDSIGSREYLTPEGIAELAGKLGLRWTIFKPWYGINWALRPVKARLLRRREPAKFYVLWAKVDNA